MLYITHRLDVLGSVDVLVCPRLTVNNQIEAFLDSFTIALASSIV